MVFLVLLVEYFCFAEKLGALCIVLNTTILDERSSEKTAITLLSSRCPSPFSLAFFLLTPFFIFSSRFLIKTRLYIVFPIYTRTQMNLFRFSSRSFIFLFFFLYSFLVFLYSYLKTEIIVA